VIKFTTNPKIFVMNETGQLTMTVTSVLNGLPLFDVLAVFNTVSAGRVDSNVGWTDAFGRFTSNYTAPGYITDVNISLLAVGWVYGQVKMTVFVPVLVYVPIPNQPTWGWVSSDMLFFPVMMGAVGAAIWVSVLGWIRASRRGEL
jgi:hypothetical protein